MFVRTSLKVALCAAGLMLVVPGDASAQKKSRDVITQEEIEKSGQAEADLFVAIRNLRPHFLEAPRGVRTMGSGMIYPLVVYVNNIKQSGTDALSLIMAKDVKEVRYLDPSRSQGEYGVNANGGAIVVKTLSAKK